MEYGRGYDFILLLPSVHHQGRYSLLSLDGLFCQRFHSITTVCPSSRSILSALPGWVILSTISFYYYRLSIIKVDTLCSAWMGYFVSDFILLLPSVHHQGRYSLLSLDGLFCQRFHSITTVCPSSRSILSALPGWVILSTISFYYYRLSIIKVDTLCSPWMGYFVSDFILLLPSVHHQGQYSLLSLDGLFCQRFHSITTVCPSSRSILSALPGWVILSAISFYYYRLSIIKVDTLCSPWMGYFVSDFILLLPSVHHQGRYSLLSLDGLFCQRFHSITTVCPSSRSILSALPGWVILSKSHGISDENLDVAI